MHSTKRYKPIICLCLIIFSVSFFSCKKYLELKPNKNTVVPLYLSDLQAMLDNWATMNFLCPAATELLADNYYLTTDIWNSLSITYRPVYIWDGSMIIDDAWSQPYRTVLYCNIVLDELPRMIDAQDVNKYNDIKGQALFFRSFSFHYLSQLFCRSYSANAATDPGISLRLLPTLNEPILRATVQQTYDRIINDLKEAAALLPDNVIAPSRPNKAAAYGMLSRVYLSMRDYANAGQHADNCLLKYNTLIDYNSLDSNSSRPIPPFHPETIFWNNPNSMTFPLSNTRARIDSNLYRLYDTNDLRKSIFFQKNADNSYGFKGSYTSESFSHSPFFGIATDEIYLVRAECLARLGQKDSALSYLNTLLVKRWKAGTFVPVTATDAADALNKILSERRKELLYRGLRWSDLRRLNQDGANITLNRVVNGTQYSLPPGDLRWELLIPWEVIYTSGVAQNPR